MSPPQVLQHFTDTFTEQRRPVTTLLATVKRRPELSQQQSALMTEYDRLEKEVRIMPNTNSLCIETLNLSLKTVSIWLKLYFYHYCMSVHVCLCVTPQLQRCREALDLSLPPPLDSVVTWLQRAEAALTDEREVGKSHADVAKDARTQKDNLEVWSLWVLVLRYLILLS